LCMKLLIYDHINITIRRRVADDPAWPDPDPTIIRSCIDHKEIKIQPSQWKKW
jgi:hypothetical protein